MCHAICRQGEGEGGCFSPEFISRYGTNQLIHSGACKQGAEACKQHFIRYGILKKKEFVLLVSSQHYCVCNQFPEHKMAKLETEKLQTKRLSCLRLPRLRSYMLLKNVY